MSGDPASATPADEHGQRPERTAFNYAQLLERAEQSNLPGPRKLIVAMELLAYGLADKARELCATIPMGFEHERNRRIDFLDRVEEGEKLLAKIAGSEAPGGKDQPPVAVEPDPRGGRRLTGVLIAPQRRPVRKAVLVFGGNADRNFPISPPILDIAACHVIVLKDPSRCFGLCDIPRLGRDFDGSVARLRLILRELGAEQVYALGFSSGGFAAMKFALALGADGALCFSTPTTLDIEDEPGKTISDYPQLSALYRKARHLGTNMAREYGAASPHPGLILVHGEEHARDKRFAGYMSGVAGTSLVPLPGHAQHASFMEAVARGMFPTLLDRMLALKPVTGATPLFAAAD